jgi:hypothetical protein
MSCEVTWRPFVPAGAALMALVMVAIGAWAHSRGELRTVALAVAAVAALLVVLAFMLRFRLGHDDSGLHWRTLARTRQVGWDQVLGVRMLEQWDDGDQILRRATRSAGAAFHVLIETRQGRINLNRWMRGVPDLLAVLEQRGLLRHLPPLVQGRTEQALHRVTETANTASDLILVGFGLFLGLLLVGFGGASKWPVTGNLLVDALLIALGLCGAVGGALAGARHLRRQRVLAGAPGGRWRARDLLFGVASALGGGLLLYGFVPRALAPAGEGVDIGLALMGLVLLGFAGRDLLRYARGD